MGASLYVSNNGYIDAIIHAYSTSYTDASVQADFVYSAIHNKIKIFRSFSTYLKY
jgi:hypothetical protein